MVLEYLLYQHVPHFDDPVLSRFLYTSTMVRISGHATVGILDATRRQPFFDQYLG